MPFTTNFGIDWLESEPYSEHFTLDQNEAHRTALVDWDKRGQFMYAMLGDTLYNPDPTVTGSFVSRVLPEKHPLYTWMYVGDAEIGRGEGHPGKDDLVDLIAYRDRSRPRVATLPGDYYYGKARVGLTYRNVDFEIAPDRPFASGTTNSELYRFVTRKVDFNVEAVALPSGSFKYYTDPGAEAQQIPEGPVKLMPSYAVSYKWWLVPEEPPWLRLNTAVGRVNARFDPNATGEARDVGYFDMQDAPTFAGPLGFNFNIAESVLFHSYQAERVRSAVGKIAWNVTCLFLVRLGYEEYRDPPNSSTIKRTYATWNRIYRAAPYNRWVDVVGWNPQNKNDNGAPPPYKAAYLDNIFNKVPGIGGLLPPP